MRLISKGMSQKQSPTTVALPPHSDEAERGALGCCLLDPQVCVPVMVSRFGKEVPEAFYSVKNQTIARSIVKLADKVPVFDIITLIQYLKDTGALEESGGVEEIASLPDATPSAVNLDSYLDIIERKCRLRKVLSVCSRAISNIHQCNDEEDELIDQIEKDVMMVRQFGGRVAERGMKSLVQGAIERLEKAMEMQGAMDGIATGFTDWDRLTGGLHPTELTVIGGATGGGKSSLAMGIVCHVAIDLGRPVGVFSLEMSAESLVLRMLCSRARIDLKKARTGAFEADDLPKLATAAAKLAGSIIHWEDASDLSLATLRAKARRMKQQHKVELIILDYIQLVDGGSGGRDENEEKQISNVARACKAAAMELNVPIVALSQLNDVGLLRGSRAIGHHADNVCRIKVREAAGAQEHDDLEAIAIPIELLVLKQRNGPTGKVPLTFLKAYTRFENAAKEETT